MAKFIYRMQNILSVKEKLETQARNEFAVASANLAREEEKLAEMVARKDGYASKLKELYSDNLDVQSIKETEDSVEIMKYHIKIQEINVASASTQLERARVKLQEAMQERKTHERLKEKQFEQFVAEQAAAESKEIDELVSYRFGQKGEENG